MYLTYSTSLRSFLPLPSFQLIFEDFSPRRLNSPDFDTEMQIGIGYFSFSTYPFSIGGKGDRYLLCMLEKNIDIDHPLSSFPPSRSPLLLFHGEEEDRKGEIFT